MFPDLQLDSVYYSHDGSVAERFFVPVLKQSVKFDRVSAYFSAKALSLYAEGLECFGHNGHLYRLWGSLQLWGSLHGTFVVIVVQVFGHPSLFAYGNGSVLFVIALVN